MTDLKTLGANINAKLKSALIWTGAEETAPSVRIRIPTRSWGLNRILDGGLPAGRIIEVYGDPSVGKTTIMVELLAGAQALGGVAVVGDAEHTITVERCRQLGCSTDIETDFIHGSPDTVEEFFDMTKMLLGLTGEESLPAASVVLLDSISALPTKAERALLDANQQKGAGRGVASRSRLLRQGFRQVTGPLERKDIALIAISHTVIGFRHGFKAFPEAGGGAALKFWASTRLRLKRKEKFVVGGVERGFFVEACNEKDKTTTPRRRCKFPLEPASGVNQIYEIWHRLVDAGTLWDGQTVCQQGSWCKIQGFYDKPEISLRYKDLEEVVEDHPGLFEFLVIAAESDPDIDSDDASPEKEDESGEEEAD